MKTNLRYIFMVSCLLLPMALLAANKMNRHGLYGDMYWRQVTTSPHSVLVRFSTNYLASDVEMPGNVLSGYKDTEYAYAEGDNSGLGNNIGGNIALAYCYKAHPIATLRTQMLVGYMRGYCNFYRQSKRSNGEIVTNHFERSMQSYLLEYSFGIEFHPFPSDFYVYLGIGGATSFIDRKFNPYIAELGLEGAVDDHITCTVPVVPVGIGYKWNVNNCLIGVEAIWHPAVVDAPGINMDGWQSGVIRDGQTYYPVVNSSNHWADSFFELGFTIGGMF